MNGWLEEDDDMNENVNNEDIEDEDVEMEVEDDAELIFPYEVEGDQTPLPRDESFDFETPNAESSDSVSSDSELEDEEIDVVPEVDVTPKVDVAPGATVGTSTQKPYVIRDFPMGLYEVVESSSARELSYVGGLAPWALRHDLETSRARARLMEAELGTCQTEIALLKSKNKKGEKERELLYHDLGDVDRTLGNVLERVSVLESGENATLKKRLDETETKLAWARIERDIAERSLHESRVWNKRFYLDMVRIGAVPKPPSDDEDTEHPGKKSKNSSSDETEGPSEPLGLVFWSYIALDGDMIMPPKAISEARIREVIREQVSTSMAEFMANMNHGTGGDEAGGGGAGGARAGGAGAGGVGPAAPEITRCTYVTFMKCDSQPFKGTEGVLGLCQWFEKLESVFRISDCKERCHTPPRQKHEYALFLVKLAMSPFLPKKFRMGVAIVIGRRVEERLTIELVEGREVEKIVRTVTKNGVEQVEYEVSDDDDSALKSTAGSVPKDYELGDTGSSNRI
ncbi:hypothetical protein Tco_0874614 [Tanacetum coccineum]|uniref:Reverse transcriptase domain-containing protein n=1 Tax=Tanacetum coccineum TaxID=301880 RepID=A0ABQ5BMV8_9ASTR